MPEIRKYSKMENPCYMEEMCRMNSKHDNDPEYDWLVIKNQNNKEFYLD